MERKTMGLVLPTQEVAQGAPAVIGRMGDNYLLNMQREFAFANTINTVHIRRAVLDGLNNRYRSTAFRTMVKGQEKSGLIDPSVVIDMKNELSKHRNEIRLPYSKSWRYQWP
jgi:hypothetical protein